MQTCGFGSFGSKSLTWKCIPQTSKIKLTLFIHFSCANCAYRTSSSTIYKKVMSFTCLICVSFAQEYSAKKDLTYKCPLHTFLQRGNLSLKPTAVQALKANPIHSDVLVYWKSIGQKSKTQEIFSHKKIEQIK